MMRISVLKEKICKGLDPIKSEEHTIKMATMSQEELSKGVVCA